MVLRSCFFNDTATSELYTYRHTLSLHDARPISQHIGLGERRRGGGAKNLEFRRLVGHGLVLLLSCARYGGRAVDSGARLKILICMQFVSNADRKSTRLNSSH